ncbi:BglG family transcription antiterminator [Azotosporobacter soli]|uniref:BglG family transcription antiterminator n=1 Tax=Azotosporobacter soli TaxID=3055040 RepID=UPI0031FF0D1E
MKELQQRQKQILKYLLQTEDFAPVKKVAAVLQCSVKTIRNDLAGMEKSGVLLEKTAGRGIRILPAGRDHIGDIVAESNSLPDLSVENRRLKILFELFEGTKEKLSIQYLADKYFVSKTSIVNDFKVIEEKLAKYNLQLKKSMQGTYLVGAESDIRKAMVERLNELICAKQVETSRIDKETILELEEHFGEFNVNQVKEIVEKAEALLQYQITEPYYINLITHLLILIRRTKQGKTIYAQSKAEKMLDTSFYRVSQEVAKCLSDTFAIPINEEEVFYIYRYLMSSGGVIAQETYGGKNNAVDDLLQQMATEMIALAEQISQLQFLFTPLLFNNLILHLKPMLNRIEYNIEIKNPLLAEIKEEFPAIVLLLKLVILKIRMRYQLPRISEDEISYIAVYFQSAIEEAIQRKNVMIICSTGVGTSHLLAKRVTNQFPEWNIVDIISAKELERKKDLTQIDLVLSTVKLAKPINKPVAYVSALFNKTDVGRIKELLVNGHQAVTEEGKLEREMPEEKELQWTKEQHAEPAQAGLVERIAWNKLEVCVYRKQSGKKEESVTVLQEMAAGKKKMVLMLADEQELSAALLRKCYSFLLKTKQG